MFTSIGSRGYFLGGTTETPYYFNFLKFKSKLCIYSYIIHTYVSLSMRILLLTFG